MAATEADHAAVVISDVGAGFVDLQYLGAAALPRRGTPGHRLGFLQGIRNAIVFFEEIVQGVRRYVLSVAARGAAMVGRGGLCGSLLN